jgi:hypothetical protein
MTDAMKERGDALENEYFRRQEQELIAKMKAKLTSNKTEESSQTFPCPKCEGQLEQGDFENIHIDICNKCGGVWLDPGELQLITKKESGGWFGRLLG